MNYTYKRPLMNILRSIVFFAVWLSILFAGQGRLYFDALGFFLAFMVAFSDWIYRFFRRARN